MKWKVNEICYFIVSNSTVKQGFIKSVSGTVALVIYDNSKGIRLSFSRLFKTEDEAINKITELKATEDSGVRRYTQYDYMMDHNL